MSAVLVTATDVLMSGRLKIVYIRVPLILVEFDWYSLFTCIELATLPIKTRINYIKIKIHLKKVSENYFFLFTKFT